MMSETATNPPETTSVSAAVVFARQVVAQVDHVQAQPRIIFHRDREEARDVAFYLEWIPEDCARIAVFRSLLAYSLGAPVKQSHTYECSGDVLVDGVSEGGVNFSVIVPAALVAAVLA